MNIADYMLKSIEVKLALAKDRSVLMEIRRAGDIIAETLRRGGRVLIAGNGGSAADAQHFAAELSGMFTNPVRQSLPALALTANSSSITAIANDYGFENVFSRQIDGLGQAGDIFMGISTSGNSRNIISALEAAKAKGMKTICLLGKGGGAASDYSDIPIIVPSDSTQFVQECHIVIAHALCWIIDEAFS